jgi:anti-sigma regulatory factor (Ser/Thr protein kinase)
VNNEISPQVPSPTPDPELVLRLSATRCGARLARHLAMRQLSKWGVSYRSSVAEAVALIVGELAANAVSHGHVPGRDFELRVLLLPEAVRVEVSDTRGERRPPKPGEVEPPADDAESGRGLVLVEALAQAWGVAQRVVGKTVWAVVARPAEEEAVADGPGAEEVLAEGAAVDGPAPEECAGDAEAEEPADAVGAGARGIAPRFCEPRRDAHPLSRALV